MSPRQLLAAIAEGRKRGGRNLWLGGGEPTIRPDIVRAIKYAKHVGYERVKLQTNGMMFAYAKFAGACHEAGLTELNLSIKGATAETHDRFARTPGCFAAMLEGIEQARERGLRLEGDVLVYRDNAAEIPEIVRTFHTLGVCHFNLWLLSSWEGGAPAEQVPRIADVMPHITAAMDLALEPAPDFITSLHTPRCTIPPGYERCAFSARGLNLLIGDAGGQWFWLEDSPIEGGAWLDSCEQCSVREQCAGPRADYRRIHGDEEFAPC